MKNKELACHRERRTIKDYLLRGIFGIAVLTSLWMIPPAESASAQETQSTPVSTPTVTLSAQENSVSGAASPDIDGGDEYPGNDYSMVALFLKGTNAFLCGASYLGDSWVLSAGHCPVDESNDTNVALDAKLCIKNITINPDEGERIKIDRVILHRDYPRTANSPADNDLTLLHLEHPPTCNAKKVTLANKDEREIYEPKDKIVLMKGWGAGTSNHHGYLWYAYGYLTPQLTLCTQSEKVLCIDQGNGKVDYGDSGGEISSFDANNNPTSELEIGVISKLVISATTSIAVRVSGQRDFIDGCQFYTGKVNPHPTLCSLYFPNNPPTLLPDFIYASKGTTVSFNILRNDYDPDGDPMRVALLYEAGTKAGIPWITTDIGGKVSISAPSSEGIYHLTAQICDDKNACTTEPVTVQVGPTLTNRVLLPFARKDEVVTVTQ